MKFMKQAFSEFHKFHNEMTTSVRCCLAKWDFITVKLNIISVRKYIVDMVVVSDVTYMRQNVITNVVI